MARSEWIDFAHVKRKADFRRVLEHAGVQKIKRTGPTQLKALCPFHDDTKPSLSVNVADNVFHCFGGGCGARGDVIDFVARAEQCSKQEAAHRIADLCGIDAQAPQRRPGRRERAEATPAAAEEAPEAQNAPSEPEETVNRPLTFELKLDPEHPYLATRGKWLTPELVRRFGLGFCSRGTMRGRICIPIHNEHGELIAYAGRWPDEEPPSEEEKYLLPGRFRKTLALFNYHRAAAHGGAHVTVVEGYFGALRLEALGFPAVSVMGSSISPEQVELLAKQWSHATLLFDGDEPGCDAADAAVVPIAEQLFAQIWRLPEGMEPDTAPEEVLVEHLRLL